jgi:chromosome segregation ATPase
LNVQTLGLASIIEKEMERDYSVNLSLDVVSENQNQLTHELENSKQVLIRVKELMTDKEREAQVKISELEEKNKEIEKNLAQVNTRAERIQKEIAEANKKAELEVNNIKSLQSKEKVELEQLKEKYNKVNKTAEEREEELKAYTEIAEELKRDKDIILLEYNILLGK